MSNDSNLWPNGDDSMLEKTFDVPESVDAPIQMGDHIGTVTLTLNGDLIGTVDLIAGQDVTRSNFLYALAQVKAFLQSLYFRVVCILTAIFLIGYTLLTVWLHRRGRNQRYAEAHGGTSRQSAAPRRNAPPRPDGARSTRAGNRDPRAARDDLWPEEPPSPPAADDMDDFDLSFLDDDF